MYFDFIILNRLSCCFRLNLSVLTTASPNFSWVFFTTSLGPGVFNVSQDLLGLWPLGIHITTVFFSSMTSLNSLSLRHRKMSFIAVSIILFFFGCARFTKMSASTFTVFTNFPWIELFHLHNVKFGTHGCSLALRWDVNCCEFDFESH